MPENSFYAFFMLIMLTFRYAFSYAENGTLCCKLCRHNAGKPRPYAYASGLTKLAWPLGQL
jgi:hypothetical protein